MENRSQSLSIVTVSRNDDHGHKLLERTQAHIDCLHEQVEEYEVPVEYIMVEWNPPDDKPPITEAVDFHMSSEFWYPRVITVPKDLHFTFANSSKIPLFQMIGKNVGVRRAHGDFILCTNIDILLSDEMFVFATSQIPSRGLSYRCDRIDVGPDVPDGERRNAVFDYCESNILRRCGRATITDYTSNPVFRYAHRGYHATRHYAARWLMKVPRVHTMACGDFTLLHRDDWFALRGYPEIPIFSIHTDSLFLLQAYYSGIREMKLEYPIYHIEHAIGTSLVPGGDAVMYKNLSKKGVPYFPLMCIPDAAEEMRMGKYKNGKFRKIEGYWTWKENTSFWGLEGYNLPEVRP